MHASQSVKRPARRSGALAALAILLVAALAGLAFWLHRTRPAAREARSLSTPVRGTYKNRALVPQAEAPAAEQALPTIQGNVYDTQGALLPGARVVALTYDTAGNMASPAASTEADAEGRFTLSLREGSYSLNVSLRGYGPTSVVAQTGDTVSAVLPRSGTITGHVVDEKGKPVKRFVLDVISAVPGDAPAPPPLWSRTITAEDGAFTADELPAWPVVVRASSPDFAPGYSRPIQLRPDDKQDLTLTLTEGCPLDGVVVDADGAPMAKVVVNAEERLTSGSYTDPAVQASLQALSGDDGRFHLDHVPRGTALLRGYDGDSAPSTVTVEVKECDKIAKVVLRMTAGGSLEGTARDADKKPVAGAKVTLAERSIGLVSALTDAEGHYRFDALPAGVLRLQLDHEGQSALRFAQIRDGMVAKLDVDLFPSGTGELRGKVLAGARPIAGAKLMVASNHGRTAGVAMYFPVTGADGSYRLTALPAGAYIVTVMSTPEGRGFEVKKDETTTIDLDVAFVPGAPDPNAPAPKPHAKRLREKRAEQEAPQDEAPTPSP